MANLHDDWDSHWIDYADAAEKNPSQKYRRKLSLWLLDLDRAAGPVRLLDIGSGQGDFVSDARARYPSIDILGLELSQSGIDIASRKVPDATFLRCNLVLPDPPPERYLRWATHAVCSEVLEHVDNPAQFLANARSYMAPGCELVVTVPGGPMSAFEKHIGHRGHFTPERLRELMAQCGFTVERTSGAGFPFFNLYKCAGYLRGRRLIEDVKKGAGGTPASRIATIAMAAFDFLFRFNVPASPWGWQMIGKAKLR
jgi:SAM-dependent methyltransferase